MRKASFLLGLALAIPGGAVFAQEATPKQPPADACRFNWSLSNEQAWFLAPSLPALDSGATLPAESPGALLRLKPVAEANLPAPPSRAPKPGTYAGVMTIPAPIKPGVYQVTLSDDGWLDVTQKGESQRQPLAHTGRRECPGLRKSLRYQLSTDPITVTVSNAAADTIKIAIAPVE